MNRRHQYPSISSGFRILKEECEHHYQAWVILRQEVEQIESGAYPKISVFMDDYKRLFPHNFVIPRHKYIHHVNS